MPDRTFKDLKKGDEVFVLWPRMRDHEPPYWSRASVSYNSGGKDGLVVGMRHYRTKDGVEAFPTSPIPGRLDLGSPEVREEVERNDVWGEVYGLVKRPYGRTPAQLREVLALLQRIQEVPVPTDTDPDTTAVRADMERECARLRGERDAVTRWAVEHSGQLWEMVDSSGRRWMARGDRGNVYGSTAAAAVRKAAGLGEVIDRA